MSTANITGEVAQRQQEPAHEIDVAQYRQLGYLVLRDALPQEEIDALRRETLAICRGQRGELPQRPSRGGAAAANDVNLSIDEDHDDDDAVLRRYLCIHFPHKISPLMRRVISHPRIASALTQLIGSPNVKCMQSMLFIKSAGKPGQAWHQDEFYIPTRDRSLTGAWIALDDATTTNGCLWVIPGSQRTGVIWPQRTHDDRRFDCAGESYGFPYKDERDAVAVEVPAGSIVFFNGYLLHRSLPNRAPAGTYRRALVNHYMSAESFLPWFPPEPGESMATADWRDIVIVAGRDPYAWKGTIDKIRPHVRASGEGGCRNWTKDRQGVDNDKAK